MVAPCINNIKHFIVQLMHKNDKILRYAAITLTTSILVHWYQIRNFSYALDVAPWWWFCVNRNMLEQFL